MKTGIPLPQTLTESVAKVKAFALQEFDRQIAKKQLNHHNREHIQQVQQRSDRIFQALAPFWKNAIDYSLASSVGNAAGRTRSVAVLP